MKRIALLTIAGLIFFCVTNVFGDTVKLIGEVPQQYVIGYFDGLGGPLGTYAGAYDLQINGIETLTYCTEFQYITPGVLYTGYTVSPLPTSDVNKRVAWIINNYSPSPTLLARNVNAQVAIWEIISGGDAGDVTAGYFRLNPWSGYGSLEGAQAIVTAVLALNVNDLSTSGVQLVHDDIYQDFVKVPEPGILLLLGLAMSAIGAASWRIRKL